MPVPERVSERLLTLDRLLEHRSRLGACILVSRSQADRVSFKRLKELLKESDGNLGAHLRKLEDAGYLRARKAFQDRRPITWYLLTRKGAAALDRHLDALRDLLDMRG